MRQSLAIPMSVVPRRDLAATDYYNATYNDRPLRRTSEHVLLKIDLRNPQESGSISNRPVNLVKQLWTIQSEAAWHSLNQSGYLWSRRKNVDRDYLPAYDWMASQMRNRIGPPPSTRVSVPVWAWYQYDGVRRQRPDLRASGHLPRGTRGYRIAFTIDDEMVVLSDFQTWHYVLNYWYLPHSESEIRKGSEKGSDQKRGQNYLIK